MAHKTLINGTSYEIAGGKTLVGGTAYSIEKGKTMVGGTAFEIKLENGIPLIVSWPDTRVEHEDYGLYYSHAVGDVLFLGVEVVDESGFSVEKVLFAPWWPSNCSEDEWTIDFIVNESSFIDNSNYTWIKNYSKMVAPPCTWSYDVPSGGTVKIEVTWGFGLSSGNGKVYLNGTEDYSSDKGGETNTTEPLPYTPTASMEIVANSPNPGVNITME